MKSGMINRLSVKRLAAGLIVCCMTVFSWAQPKVPREFQFAALGGTNLSSYTFNPSSPQQNKALGYIGGLGVRYIEEKYFGLQCELLLAKRGVKDRYDTHPEFSFERQWTYVELPMMAHVYFNLGKRSEISLDLGAKIGYNVGDKTKSNLDDSFQNFADSTIHGYRHHDLAIAQKFDYGIQAGLGYEFKLNPQMSLQVQGRYYFGLEDIFPNTKADVFETSSNQSIQIVVALWWHHRIKVKSQRDK